MGRTLYLECESGISGDMVVGALLDAGADEQGLLRALESLGIGGYEVRVSQKEVGALVGCDFDVILDADHENHDHDMQWLYGGVEDTLAPEAHDHHTHDHGHVHEHGHHHEHRQLADIRRILDASGLEEAVRSSALKVFEVIAEAEAKAHGATPETVHFHEVGAVDSIVDVVAAAWCLNDLGVDDVVVSPLAEGEGQVRSAHGVLSIPVPAVANIVEAHGLVLRRAHRPGELVTPTGAAIAAAFGTTSALPETYRIVAKGMGCGKRAYDPPSTLRATIMEEVLDPTHAKTTDLWKLETEVDDCSGEALGYVLEHLYGAGAREAHFLPVFMKKGRPGYQIEVLCDKERIPMLESILFADTTTIGIRRCQMERTVLERREVYMDTPYGPIRAKQVVLPDESIRTYPEHDAVAAAARDRGIGYQDVVKAANRSSAGDAVNL